MYVGLYVLTSALATLSTLYDAERERVRQREGKKERECERGRDKERGERRDMYKERKREREIKVCRFVAAHFSTHALQCTRVNVFLAVVCLFASIILCISSIFFF